MRYKYPLRFKWHDNPLVVEFDGLSSGTVIVAGYNYKVGAYKISWVHHDSPDWVPVVSSVKSRLHLEVKNYG